MFVQDYLLQRILVQGEVSNCKYHTSGHIYFTLKDPKGTINCVMFAGNRSGLSFRLMEGQQVVVGGTVDVYERDGKYQLYAKQITLDGAGLLYEKFEQLKAELAELGMFAKEYKRPIPQHVKKLGVVTAATGAAVRDIIQVASRRNPYVQIILYPAIVQGEAAAESIVKGIRALEALGVDCMIVGRGGGSIEDLWAFNERIVAQAVFDCCVPIISAVGHETDTTIIDFVSDLRAPTPSAAAELAVKDIRELFGTLEGYKQQLNHYMSRVLSEKKGQCKIYEQKLRLAGPVSKLREQKLYAITLEDKLRENMEKVMVQKKHRLALAVAKMKGLSPLEKLESGFSYVESEGENIRSVQQLQEGKTVKIRFKDGSANAKITGITANES